MTSTAPLVNLTNSYPVALLDERNALAESITARYARDHAVADGTSGAIGGLVPIPGAGAVVAVGQLLHQSKRLYPALARDLAAVYLTPPEAFAAYIKEAHEDEKRLRAWLNEMAMSFDEVAQIGLALVQAFDPSFLQDIAQDLALENGPSLLLSAIPYIGAGAGAALDALVAVTMTWRVGAMISLHVQNGGFVGSRRETWKLVRSNLVKRSTQIERKGLFDRIRAEVPEVRQHLIRTANEMVEELISSGLTLGDAHRFLQTGSGPFAAFRVPADIFAKI